MARPLKPDRDSIAITSIRVSPKVRQLLHDLRLKHGFTTIDQVLRYYLPSDVSENKAIFHSAKEIYDLTRNNRDMLQRPNVNKLISSASKEIYHKYVSPRQRTVRLPVSGNRVKRFTD